MNTWVDIEFECLPLRSVTRFDVPIDAPPQLLEEYEKIKRAIDKHGRHNTYYLHYAKCVFHLTNSPDVGMLTFRFEGTVMTDAEDRQTQRSDLLVELEGDTCDWLTQPIVAFLEEAVHRAVRVEFDRYISAGDLEQTVKRIERIQAESDAQGGFLGFGL